jgi:exodeoxyribonuclease VII large subunit
MPNNDSTWLDETSASRISNSAIRLRDLLEQARQAVRAAFKEALWVFAEVQDIRTAERGHIYLTLVDSQGGQVQTKGILWQSRGAQRLAEVERARGERLTKGEKVFVLCMPEYHPTYGFSLTVTDIQFAETLGPAERALRHALKRLAQEGIISRNRDLPLPHIIFRVAVVAPKGAAGLLDFQRILFRERHRAPVVLNTYHSTFQGEAAAQEIPIAISHACAWNPDVIVLARGGGSKADLLHLNNYAIGRAICECQVPVWSGIGHSTDKTLVDELAHQVFKTPSDAAHRIANIVEAAFSEVDEISREAAQSVSVMTERVAEALRRDLSEMRSSFLGTLEKAGLKTNELAATASSCGRMVTMAWTHHLALRRAENEAATSASLAKASTNTRDQAQISLSAFKLVEERWANVLHFHQVTASSAAQSLLRSLNARVLTSYNVCEDGSRLGLHRVKREMTDSRSSISTATGRCLQRLMQKVADGWQEPKKASSRALLRASAQTHQNAHAIKSLLSVKIKSVQADFSQRFLLVGQTSRSMASQHKLLIENQLRQTRRIADVALVRAQISCDRLCATLEAADIHGPLRRGFVMVTNTTGQWLRAAKDTVSQMRLVYTDGIVQVRKNEPESVPQEVPDAD